MLLSSAFAGEKVGKALVGNGLKVLFVNWAFWLNLPSEVQKIQ